MPKTVKKKPITKLPIVSVSEAALDIVDSNPLVIKAIGKKKLGRPIKKHAGGRPPHIDQLTLQKLEDAFAFSATDEEACIYAGIQPRTLYNYQEKNPEFVQRKQLLKKSVNLIARRTVVQDVKANPSSAWKWLEKKLPEEFGDKNNDSGLLLTQFEAFLDHDTTTIKSQTLKLKPKNE